MIKVVEMVRGKLNEWKEYTQGYRYTAKVCLIIFILYMIGISAILRANFNYRDDLRRIMEGNQGWGSSFGRYISDFLSTIFHTDNYMTDISPLSQIIAVVFMAAAATIIWYIISSNKKFTIWDMAALIPLGLSPYFLACMSYKFDAPYMAFSVFISIVPLLFAGSGYSIYFMVSFLGSLAMCMTYQASSGIFPMFVIVLCLRRWNQKENIGEILKFIVVSIAAYLSGLLLYKTFLMPKRERYVSNSLPSIKDIIPTTIFNLKKYYFLVISDFKTEWLVLIFLLCIAFLFVMVCESKQKKYVAFLVSAVSVALLLLLAFGMYPVLVKPLWHPRAMYGFGVFIVFIGISVSTAQKISLAKLVNLLLAWCFFVFSFTYGNALKIQNDYIDFRTIEVINDLKDLDIMMSDQKVKIQMEGSIGYAYAIKRMPKHYNMLRRLLPTAYINGNWSLYKFYYYGFRTKKVAFRRRASGGGFKNHEDFKTYNLPVLKDTMFHTIRGKDNCILIEMK